MSGRKPLIRTDDLVSRARALSAAGWGKRRIAAELGVSPTTALRMISPDYLSREREWNRLDQRKGVCEDCGAPISSNRSYPAKRCHSCHAHHAWEIRKAARLDGVAAGKEDA